MLDNHCILSDYTEWSQSPFYTAADKSLTYKTAIMDCIYDI